ncbi:MAG: hypothetical protein P1R58_10020 [bacterium]|nr:hypothetical protein [bacterium]
MSFNRRFLHRQLVIMTITGLMLLAGFSTSIQSQPILEFSVGSNYANPGDIGVEIPIYVVNTNDTIAGFEFWLQLSHPGVASFQVTVDTTGTLSSGWQFIDSRSLSGVNADVRVVGIANSLSPPYNPGFGPQDGSIPLIKVFVDAAPIPDTMVSRVTEIIPSTFLDNFGFSDPHGNSIGIVTDSILDTNYYVCNAWVGPDCLDSSQVLPGMPFDWMVVSWDYYAYLDTTAVTVSAGFISVLPEFICGDFTIDGGVDINDLTTFVDYMFAGGPLPQFWQAMDCDASEALDVIDLTCFVDFMFAGGTFPLCFPPE